MRMALYLQHGHGKSDKISTAFQEGVASGVILSARNESRKNMSTCIQELQEYGCEILVDPQFYVSTLVPPKDGYLPQDYKEYYTAGRTSADFISAKKNRQYATGTLDVQLGLKVTTLLSPSVIFDSFSDKWCQTALTLADASVEYHAELTDAPPLLLTIIFDESALSSKGELDKFLDIVTTWAESAARSACRGWAPSSSTRRRRRRRPSATFSSADAAWSGTRFRITSRK